MYAFFTLPDVFNACIAGSPYPLEYLWNMIASGEVLTIPENRFLYSSIGTIKDINRAEFEKFEDIITKKAPKTLEYHFQINDGENHISNIAVNFQDGLEKFYIKE